jgi:broad specificity phosphatase PhoE
MRLLLVRHGQTRSNIVHALDTAYPGAELTDLGHQQAELLAASLASDRIDVVAASTLLRAEQTAGPVAEARGLPVMTFRGLGEVWAGELEMYSDSDSIDTYQRVVVSWATGELQVQMPGGISGHEFVSRFDEAIQVIEAAVARAARTPVAATATSAAAEVAVTEAPTVESALSASAAGTGGSQSVPEVATAVVVSHGAAIRTWVAIRCDGVDVVDTANRNLVNTGMFILEGSTRAGWRLERRIDPIADSSPVPAA